MRNDHTGTLDVVPYLSIFDSRGQVCVNDGEPVSILPGETAAIQIPFVVPRSTLVDAAGYFGTVMFDVSEPGTMSIGGTEGPYMDHFFVGSKEEIEAARSLYRMSQPLGREMAAGEWDERIFNVSGETEELRLFLAAQPGAELNWSISDPSGNSTSIILNGEEETVTNNIENVDIRKLYNIGDFITITDPVEGEYSVSVSV